MRQQNQENSHKRPLDISAPSHESDLQQALRELGEARVLLPVHRSTLRKKLLAQHPANSAVPVRPAGVATQELLQESQPRTLQGRWRAFFGERAPLGSRRNLSVGAAVLVVVVLLLGVVLWLPSSRRTPLGKQAIAGAGSSGVESASDADGADQQTRSPHESCTDSAVCPPAIPRTAPGGTPTSHAQAVLLPGGGAAESVNAAVPAVLSGQTSPVQQAGLPSPSPDPAQPLVIAASLPPIDNDPLVSVDLGDLVGGKKDKAAKKDKSSKGKKTGQDMTAASVPGQGLEE